MPEIVGAGLLRAIAEKGTAGAREYRQQQAQEAIRERALLAEITLMNDNRKGAN